MVLMYYSLVKVNYNLGSLNYLKSLVYRKLWIEDREIIIASNNWLLIYYITKVKIRFCSRELQYEII